MIRLNIVNDGSGTEEVGNYICEVLLPDRSSSSGLMRIETDVRGFDRSRGWAALVREVVDALENEASPDAVNRTSTSG